MNNRIPKFDLDVNVARPVEPVVEIQIGQEEAAAKLKVKLFGHWGVPVGAVLLVAVEGKGVQWVADNQSRLSRLRVDPRSNHAAEEVVYPTKGVTFPFYLDRR